MLYVYFKSSSHDGDEEVEEAVLQGPRLKCDWTKNPVEELATLTTPRQRIFEGDPWTWSSGGTRRTNANHHQHIDFYLVQDDNLLIKVAAVHMHLGQLIKEKLTVCPNKFHGVKPYF